MASGLGLGARDWHWDCSRCDHCCCLGEPTLGRRILGRLPRLRLSSRVRLWLRLRARLLVRLRLRARLLVRLRLRAGLLVRRARLWVRTRLFVWARVLLLLWNYVRASTRGLRLRSGWTSRWLREHMGFRRPVHLQLRPKVPCNRFEEYRPRRQSATLVVRVDT